MLVGAGLPEGGLPVRLPWGDRKGRPYERFYFRRRPIWDPSSYTQVIRAVCQNGWR